MTRRNFALAAAGAARLLAAESSKRKIVFIAGEKSHGPGEHEYLATMNFLKSALTASPNAHGLSAEVVPHGWPADPSTLDDASSIVVMSDGQDHDTPTRVPFMTPDRMQVMERQMSRGCGLILIHYSTFISFPYDKQTLEWTGGFYNWDERQQPLSKIKTLTADVVPASHSHPITNGVAPFRLHDEFYYNLKFRTRDPQIQPILRVPALSSDPQQQIVAWAFERSNGGRAFSLTNGHYFVNWNNDQFRKLMLNAIVWTAHIPIPSNGVQSVAPDRTSSVGK